MSLRIYGTNYDDNELDISFLLKTPTLRSLSIQVNCLNLAEILPKLVNLKELEIHIGDYVRDWDLSFLEKMTNLEYLGFYKWYRKGKNIDLSPTKHLTNLKKLDIRGCDINLKIALTNKPNLKTLILHQVKHTYIECIKDLQNLESLSLYNIKVEDLSFLQHLKKLEYLQLCKTNSLTSIDILPQLKNLVCINLQEIHSLDNFPVIKGLKRLKYIEITNCKLSNYDTIKFLNSAFHFNFFYGTHKKDILPNPECFIPVASNKNILSFRAGSYIKLHTEKIEEVAISYSLRRVDGILILVPRKSNISKSNHRNICKYEKEIKFRTAF